MSQPPYSGQPPMEPPPPYAQPSPAEPPYGQPQYQGHPAPGFPPPGGYPPPPPAADNKRTLLIVGGIAAAVVVLLLVTVGVVLALSGGDDKTPPTAAGSSSAPSDKRSEPGSDDESSPPDEEDGGDDASGGGTHKPVEHMCQKLDGTPLQALYDTVSGEPSESLRDVGDTAVATCVTSLTKGSNRLQHAMVTCSGFYHPDAEKAGEFFDYQRKSATDTLAKGPVEEVPDLGDKAILYSTSSSTSLQSLVVVILDDNLVLQAKVMASHASRTWTPATANQLKQAVIAAAKATLPKVTAS